MCDLIEIVRIYELTKEIGLKTVEKRQSSILPPIKGRGRNGRAKTETEENELEL